MRIIILFFSLLLCLNVLATPKEIVIVRHADKWAEHSGPALNPTGYARAINFAFYFLQQFGPPDYVVSTSPYKFSSNYSRSIREMQTIAPLVNILTTKKTTRDFFILDPYPPADYRQLAKWLLEKSKFNNQLVLVCWDHRSIPKLAKKLGVKQQLPTWPEGDFDSVYILKYNQSGQLASFKILHHQYPTKEIKNWAAIKEILTKVAKPQKQSTVD